MGTSCEAARYRVLAGGLPFEYHARLRRLAVP
jgi:hypothetical protein